jgi:hypothetical protein
MLGMCYFFKYLFQQILYTFKERQSRHAGNWHSNLFSISRPSFEL